MSKFYTGIDVVVRATELVMGYIVNIAQLRAVSEADKIVALWNRKIKSAGRRNTINIPYFRGKQETVC